LSQELTLPDAEFEDTISFLKKLFDTIEISNIGKCFTGIALPAEFIES